jgi:glycosyltransferase involved in cell wall biosynthesis
MDRDVNINAVQYFYENILPIIKLKIPEVKFYVVGNNPPQIIKELSEKDQNIIVTGFVEDIKAYYLKASVFVAPLFVGGGVIVKILDAMASGLPVVTTSVGNEGIEAVPGRDIEIADEPKVFAKKILLLLQKPDIHSQISNNGQAFVYEKYGWSKIVRGIEDDYKKIIHDKVVL